MRNINYNPIEVSSNNFDNDTIFELIKESIFENIVSTIKCWIKQGTNWVVVKNIFVKKDNVWNIVKQIKIY